MCRFSHDIYKDFVQDDKSVFRRAFSFALCTCLCYTEFQKNICLLQNSLEVNFPGEVRDSICAKT